MTLNLMDSVFVSFPQGWVAIWHMSLPWQMEAALERQKSPLKVKMPSIGWMDTKQGSELSVQGHRLGGMERGSILVG